MYFLSDNLVRNFWRMRTLRIDNWWQFYWQSCTSTWMIMMRVWHMPWGQASILILLPMTTLQTFWLTNASKSISRTVNRKISSLNNMNTTKASSIFQLIIVSIRVNIGYLWESQLKFKTFNCSGDWMKWWNLTKW